MRDCFAKASAEGYALACEALGAADLRSLAASIQAPTLVLCGKDELPPLWTGALAAPEYQGCRAGLVIACQTRFDPGAA